MWHEIDPEAKSRANMAFFYRRILRDLHRGRLKYSGLDESTKNALRKNQLILPTRGSSPVRLTPYALSKIEHAAGES